MATTDGTGTRSVYNTLSTTTVDTVNLQGTWSAVEVINFDASNTLWFTLGEFGNINAQAPTPSASLNEAFAVPASTSLVVQIANGAAIQPQVKVVGSGGAYGVIGHPTAATNRSKNA